ncbi:Hemin transport protein HemS [Sodalis glossinidius str. 'morsitans']|uniref:Heme/hemoglobin transport protein n=1 Tax=Sodalis glossinidius (strain morsitans) TaxID=343509 RepID=Q2NSU5_SODGM|nr:hemin-degrading factor [Sodalis glossinidius]BAE74780.1 putative heme/hemoglobin transport protein [Sodalis glossinidius str. 'morsitans']CRL45575.1 Hemin transport protein HemS [Sodalis glossinidius str. 'morsitans']
MELRYQQYLALKAEHPHKYARDLAAMAGLREAELTLARVGHDACALRPDFATLLPALRAVGETKTINRNEYAIHEQVGQYENVKLQPHVGLVLNPRGLDLRLFAAQWQSVFALNEQTPQGELQSIQLFDSQGDSALKIYATPNTSKAAWQALIERYTVTLAPALDLAPEPVATNSPRLDTAQVEQEWRAMTDVHQFFGLLKRHGLSRQQAFRAVPNNLAYQVENDALRVLLPRLEAAGNEVMIFVGNRSCIQVFTGPVQKQAPIEDWLNIFNPTFTLHLREDTIAESWVTRKPTRDGMVTSLELFAADGVQIAQLNGQRTEGEREQRHWRQQIAALDGEGAHAGAA